MATPTDTFNKTTNVPLTGSDNDIDSLIHGVKWGGGLGSGVSLTYSVVRGTPYWINPYSDNDEPGFFGSGGWSSISSAQESAFEKALQTIATVANIQFQEVDDNQATVGDIRIAKSTNISDDNSAWAYIPGDHPAGGDIWLNADDFTSAETAALGTFEFHILIHETGHALGLKHPFESEDTSPSVLNSDFDNIFFTVMSYTYDLGDEGFTPDRYPTTPMLLDIQALQYLYGPNTSFNSGNTTYVFNSSGTYFLTLWDGGGTDTIRYESSIGGEIDLREGYWSQLGQPIEYRNSAGAFQYEVDETVMIAYGANIENAIGGNGPDHLIGNDLGNTLQGGAGNDTLEGWDGNDYLVGGAGVDTMYGDDGNDRYLIDSPNEINKSIIDAGTDTVISITSYNLGSQQENLTISGAANLNGTGNALGNVMIGNSGANTLTGGLGNDFLNGGAGNDLLRGGAGNDTYVIDSSSEINRATADAGIDTVRSTVSYILGPQQENLLLLGSARLNGWGNGGANTMTGNNGTNVLTGGLGNDVLSGGSGSDRLSGEAGDDTYIIDGINEIVTSTLDPGVDTVRSTVSYVLGAQQENLVLLGTANLNGWGNGAANTLTGNSGNNALTGAGGNDTLTGGLGNDSLVGAQGSDQLNGGAGVDRLDGGPGTDVLIGAAGNDLLIGGTGNDTITGGAGDDRFLFNTALSAKNVDVITDFSNSSENDVLRLDNDIFSALMTSPGNALDASEFKANVDGLADEPDDRIIYNTATGALYYDADGSDPGLPIQFAVLTGFPGIDSADLFVSN